MKIVKVRSGKDIRSDRWSGGKMNRVESDVHVNTSRRSGAPEPARQGNMRPTVSDTMLLKMPQRTKSPRIVKPQFGSSSRANATWDDNMAQHASGKLNLLLGDDLAPRKPRGSSSSSGLKKSGSSSGLKKSGSSSGLRSSRSSSGLKS